MPKKNQIRWESTKLQIDIINFPAYTDFPSSVAYIKELKCSPQYITDMLGDLIYAILSSYRQVKDNNSFNIIFFYE